ncbi:hypothetical protein KKG16_02040 [Patescibacteria group bacterium]|nr:hypothetical protein [Patescibacteria group bacterium]
MHFRNNNLFLLIGFLAMLSVVAGVAIFIWRINMPGPTEQQYGSDTSVSFGVEKNPEVAKNDNAYVDKRAEQQVKQNEPTQEIDEESVVGVEEEANPVYSDASNSQVTSHEDSQGREVVCTGDQYRMPSSIAELFVTPSNKNEITGVIVDRFLDSKGAFIVRMHAFGIEAFKLIGVLPESQLYGRIVTVRGETKVNEEEKNWNDRYKFLAASYSVLPYAVLTGLLEEEMVCADSRSEATGLVFRVRKKDDEEEYMFVVTKDSPAYEELMKKRGEVTLAGDFFPENMSANGLFSDYLLTCFHGASRVRVAAICH